MRSIRAGVLLLLLLVVAVAAGGPSARADDDPTHTHDDPAATTTTLPGAVAIGDGYSFSEAVITGPEGTETRTLDGYHAATFVQSWLGEAFFGTPLVQDPPPELPVYRVDVTGTWGVLTGAMTVYYASDGTTAWVSFPQDQVPATTPTTPPPPSGWFVASGPVIAAFNGKGTLEPTAGVVSSTTSSVPSPSVDGPDPGTDGDGASNTIAWGLGAAAVAAVGAGLVVLRRRS